MYQPCILIDPLVHTIGPFRTFYLVLSYSEIVSLAFPMAVIYPCSPQQDRYKPCNNNYATVSTEKSLISTSDMALKRYKESLQFALGCI